MIKKKERLKNGFWLTQDIDPRNNGVDAITNFFEDKVESSPDAEVYTNTMMTLKRIGSLDLDERCVTSNKILIVWNGALLHTTKPIKRIFFPGMNIRWT